MKETVVAIPKRQRHVSLMRTLRQASDKGMPIVGVVVILAAVLFVRELRLQLAIVVVGLFLVEAGVWNLSQWLLPNDRQYVGLRAEGDHFITLIRQLNAAAVQLKAADDTSNREAFETAREAMHESVDKMAWLAGKTEGELHERTEVAV
jgi:hypothetical protein